jgi:FkbM family methyltransferase
MTTIARNAAFLKDLFETLPSLPNRHPTSDPLWRVWNVAVQDCIAKVFGADGPQKIAFGPFGDLELPYTRMGAIDSCDLFGLDELILFSFYNANRGRYKKVVDFGANIGLHSFVLARCGFAVRSFEPDPRHAEWFKRTMMLNGTVVDLHQAAISLSDGQLEFTRVLGNTTGSHLRGAKAAPYGELEVFPVNVEAAGPHLAWADLAKIDIEGHEANLITGLPVDAWTTTDAVVEVGSETNAAAIFNHLHASPINLFSQRCGWQKVSGLHDMPTSHRDGSLFISAKSEMPWG